MSFLLAVPYTAFSGRQLWRALVARMTDAGRVGLSPVRLVGADSTLGAPLGGCWAAGLAGLAGLGTANAAAPIATAETPAASTACRSERGRAVMPDSFAAAPPTPASVRPRSAPAGLAERGQDGPAP